MILRVPKFLFLAAGFLMAIVVSGCLNDNPATSSGDADVKVKATSTDPRIAFLVEGGIRESAITRVIDEETNDTTYQVFPVLSAEDKAKGMLVGGFGFTTMTLDAMIKKKLRKDVDQVVGVGNGRANASDNALDIAPGLAKKAHTRWDYWYSGLDVKSLTEVHQVKVFITVTGSTKLGPNWQAGIRAGIANWNAQAKGTAVSFVETTDPNNCDVKIMTSYGIGSDGTATHMAFMTADPYIESNGVSLWVNSGYEHNGVPHNQKTTVAMSLLALSTNITFTGMEGMYWNMGDVIHIPGTPATEGDAYTPGSSILTYGTSPVSTPVMTQGDLKALRTVYPLHGVSAITNYANYGYWRTVGYESYRYDLYGVASAQVAGDTVFMNSVAGSLARRIGLYGTLEWIYSGGGSSRCENFAYSKGNLVVKTVSGSLYTMMPGGGWVLQATGVSGNDFRLDGNRLTYAVTNPGNWFRSIYTKYIVPGGPSNPILTYHETSYLSDFRTHNGLLVVADGGYVYAMQNFTNWVTLQTPSSGYAERIYLSDNLIAMYYYTPYYWEGSVAVRTGGLYGSWSYYTNPVYGPDDIDICGDKMAFLQQDAWLRVIDYSTWAIHEHYQLPNAPTFSKVQLTGANCDYVKAVDHSGNLWTKYGVDLNTDYIQHLSAVIALPQKW